MKASFLLESKITQKMSSKKFLSVYKNNRRIIKSSTFVPSKPGSGKFGYFFVELNNGY